MSRARESHFAATRCRSNVRQHLIRKDHASDQFGTSAMGSKPPFAFAETFDDAPAAKLTLVFRQ